jgi:hypothetical protein
MTAALSSQPHRLTHLSKGFGALTQCAVVLLGIPYALIQFVGNPLPASWPSPGEVRLAIELRDFSDRLIIGALAVALWICWAMAIGSIGLHAVEGITHATHRVPRFIPPSLHRLVGRWIGAAGLMVAMLGRPAAALGADRPLLALTAPTVPATTALTPDPETQDLDPGGQAFENRAARGRTYTIRDRDSLWSIAEATLGDGSRWKDILHANRELITDPDVLPDGEVIVIPSSDFSGNAHEVVVRPGDNMWDLTASHLEEHLGDAPTNSEIVPAWLDVIEANRESIRSGDPDLIYPGEILELPLLDGEAPELEVVTPVMATPPLDEPPATVPPTTLPASMTVPNTAKPNASVESVVATATDEDRAPWLLGLGLSGIGAATAIIALQAKRRRGARFHHPGDSIPATTEVQRTLISELRGIATPERIPSVDRTLRFLAARATSETLPEVVLVRVGDNSVELLTERAERHCPPGFAVLDDATIVIHPDTPDEEIDETLDQALPLCPALVSIGADDIGDILIDLERTGTLVIEAETTEQAAIATETPHHPWAKDNTIYAVGLTGVVAGLPGITSVEDVDGLIEQLGRVVDGLDDELREEGTHCDRLNATEIRPTTVFLIGPDQGGAAKQLAQLAVRGSAIAIVSASPTPSATWRLVVTGSTATLEPMGIELSNVAMLAPAACGVLTGLLDEPESGTSIQLVDVPSIDDTRSTDDLIAEILKPTDVELILLDEVPRLEGVTHNGKNAARADEVVAFLVLHGPACPRQVGEALWPGRRNTAEQVSQAVSRTRTLLGDVNGRPRLVPARRNAPYRLEGVGCDWTRFQALTRLADARPMDELRCLKAALDLVKGSPFAGRRERAFEWVGDLGYETNVRIAIGDVALRAGQTLLATDPRGALDAALVGRLAIPDHEGVLRIRVAALCALGDKTGGRDEVSAALQAVANGDGLLADLEPATLRMIERLSGN